MSVIEIGHLSKQYHHRHVFSDFSGTISQGELILLMGKNGTGKSTFIRCLLNLVRFQGTISSRDMRFSYAPEKTILPDYISLYEFLYLVGRVRKIPKDELHRRLGHYMDSFRLRVYQDQYIGRLSQGTRQKALLIQALINDADVYLFDEPLNGLDAESRKVFMEEIRELRRRDKTVIIATHQGTSYRFPDKRIFRFGQGVKHVFVIPSAS